MLRCKNEIIASKIVYCDSIIRKGTGLTFRGKNSVEDTAWIFRFKKSRRVNITMFMVFFPIDIVFLDSHNKIIELKENFKPFQNHTSASKMTSFIELKKGVIKKYSLKKGDVLTF